MSNVPYLSTYVQPASEPVTLTEAKAFLRLDTATEDALVTDLIKTARQYAEEFLNKSIITQTLQLQYDFYTPPVVNLLRGPVQSVTSVIIIAQNLTETTLSASAYTLRAGNKQICFSAAPMGNIIQIRYVAGYGLAAAVPAPIKLGILGHIASMYENRGQNDLPADVRKVYAPYRTFRV